MHVTHLHTYTHITDTYGLLYNYIYSFMYVYIYTYMATWLSYLYKVKCIRVFMCVCGFGVRIVPLYPPACRKRRLTGGMRGSLVVTFAAAKCQGPRFYLDQGRNLDQHFCSMRSCAPLFRFWDHNIGYQSQSQAWKLTKKSDGSTEWVQIRRP